MAQLPQLPIEQILAVKEAEHRGPLHSEFAQGCARRVSHLVNSSPCLRIHTASSLFPARRYTSARLR